MCLNSTELMIAYLRSIRPSCIFFFLLLFVFFACEENNPKQVASKDNIQVYLSKSALLLPTNSDSALIFAQLALKVAKRKEDAKNEIRAQHSIGKVLVEKEMYGEAIKRFRRALSVPAIKSDLELAAVIYHDIGKSELLRQNHLSAIINFRKSLNYKDKVSAPEILALSAEALGDIYFEMLYINNALKFYQEAQGFYKSNTDEYNFYVVKNKIGELLQADNQLNEALTEYQASLAYFSAHEEGREEEASTRVKMAAIFINQQKPAEAEKMAEDAKSIAFELSNLDMLMDSYFILGKVSFDNSDFGAATKHFNESLELAQILNDEDAIIENYRFLANAEDRLGNTRKSVNYFKEYQAVTAKLLEQQKEQKVRDILTNIKLNKSEKELASLERRNHVIEKYSSLRSEGLGSNRGFIILLTAFVIVFILLVALYYKRFKDKKNISKILEETVKERTDALNRTLQKLSFHVNNTSLAVIELSADQKVSVWSKRSEKIFGWAGEEVENQELFETAIFPEGTATKIRTVFNKLKKGKLSRKFLLLKNFHKSGALLYIEWNFSVHSDENGNILSILCFANDVTHRELALAEAETANKELDNFIYKTSHDVKGPIARIEGLINLGLIEAKEPVSVDYFKRLNNVAASFNIVLSRLFRIHGLYYHKTESVTLNLKSEIVQLLESLKRKNDLYDLMYEVDIPDDIKCVTDKLLLHIIIQNLYENALDYRKDGLSTIVFSAELVRTNYLKFQVRDNGTCIPLEAADRIFDMFFQNTAQSSTAGLGLYMVKKSVEKLGGTIQLLEDKSETIFEILLPKASA